MTKITQIILKLWTWINSIFGYDTKKSTEPEAVGYYRVIIVGFKVAGRLFRCDIVPHRDESGGYHCAILRRVGYPPLTARMIQDVGEYIARDYFHRAADSLSWIYFPLRSEEVTSEDVLQFRFVHDETNGEMRVVWYRPAPEVASAWLGRAGLALEFGARISVR
jgi:hypothetical protein